MPIVIAIIAIIALIAGISLFTNKADVTTEENIVNTETPARTDSASTDNDGEMTPDTITGTFIEDTTYTTPKRTTHKMKVSLTLVDDVITDSSIIYDESEGYSTGSQESFDELYKNEVIGKNINEVSLSRIGGASLTTEAFNDAVAKIAEKNS